MCVCLNRSCVRSFAGCADLNLAGRTVEEGLVSQVQWRSNDDFLRPMGHTGANSGWGQGAQGGGHTGANREDRSASSSSLAIWRTGVSLSVHLYMVITGRLALVLLDVPLSVPSDWPVGAASSSAFYEVGQWVKWVFDRSSSSSSLFHLPIIFFRHSLFTSRIWKGKSVYYFAWFADVRMIY